LSEGDPSKKIRWRWWCL